MEGMLAKGFTVAVAPGGVVWVAGAGARDQVCRRHCHAARGGDSGCVGGAGSTRYVKLALASGKALEAGQKGLFSGVRHSISHLRNSGHNLL